LETGPLAPEVRERLETAYGLDRPAPERFGRWLGAVLLRGELGWSLSRSRPVSDLLASALPNTLLLSGAGLGLHLLAAVGLGLLAARVRGRLLDRIIGAAGLALWAMPAFWLGLMAILVLAYAVPVFPPAAARSVGAEAWPLLARLADRAWHLALPAGVLGLASAAATARFLRAGLLEASGEGFIRAARSRGVSPSRALVRHALRNALLPLITLIGLSLPSLVSGALALEVVFAWPGMGRLAWDAVMAHDLPVVMACTLASALVVVLGNLGADLTLIAADPRIRLGRNGR
jgi:peptide/nickel transport system permease protein